MNEKRKEKKSAEVNALKPILRKDRMSWVSMAFIQAGICVCVPSFLLGALLAESMTVWNAIISGTLGYVIVVAMMTILGHIGSDLGIATCTITQAGLGVKGARYIVSLVFAANLIGWFGINNNVCGAAFSNFCLEVLGLNIPIWVSSVLWGLIMLSTAVFGMSALEKLDKLSIPLLMVIMLVGTYLALSKFGLDGLNSAPEYSMSFLAGVGLSFNFYAIGAVAPSDFTRFQKTRKDVAKSTIWGVFPMGVFTLVLGILMTKLADNFDISMVLISIGLPTLGVLALVLSTWTTNSTNAYTAALNLTMAFNIPDNRRREVTAVAGIIGTVLGAVGILDHVEGLLSMMACIACPIGGIMLADYWIIGKGDPHNGLL
ncbi:MAG: cytosine permease [Clostridiales bacterium]|nr:cytosine permease [Clostridiales bacterium]